MSMSKWDFINRLESIDGGFDKYRLKESDVTPDFIGKANQLFSILNIEPRKSPEFEAALGLTGSKVRKLIHWLRANGRPIVSSDKGYAIAIKPEELDPTIKQLIDRAFAIMAVALELEKTREKMRLNGTGQLELVG